MVDHQCGGDGKGGDTEGEEGMLTSTDGKGSDSTCAECGGYGCTEPIFLRVFIVHGLGMNRLIKGNITTVFHHRIT
jgi:hypothetical protein